MKMMQTTVEDLKQQYSMADILDRYGLQPNREGFISCPFHKEKTASCKIYKNSWYCFGCGEGGDIFDFVEKYEGIGFKDAFKALGGDYSGKISRRVLVMRRKHRIEQEKRAKAISEAEYRFDHAMQMLSACEEYIRQQEPFSDDWCVAQNYWPELDAEADAALENLLAVRRRE